MCLSQKGVYSKDYCGKLTSTDTNDTRRSKQNTYHVVNKNIAPSKLPMEVDERGDAFRASASFDFLVSLDYLGGAMGIPKLRLLPLLIP